MNQKSENDIDEKTVEKELVPTMGLTYLVEVTDKDGKVIQRISAPSRSFVRQWYDIMSVHADAADRTCKDTDGISRTISPHEISWFALATATVTTHGIRVGKGTTAVSISDYKLESPIEEGTGLDQLEHLVVGYVAPVTIGSTCSFTINRSMINNSGSTITGIKEIGVYVQTRRVTNGIMGPYNMLGFRDVLPSAMYIPDGGAITVTYTLKVTA